MTEIYEHIAETWRVYALEPPAPAIFASLEKLGIESAEKTSRMYSRQWSGGMLQHAAITAAQARQSKLTVRFTEPGTGDFWNNFIVKVFVCFQLGARFPAVG